MNIPVDSLVMEENGTTMTIGMISYADAGNWYLGEEGIPLQLLKCYGMLLLCQSPTGRVYYPAHDILRPLSEADAKRILRKLGTKAEALP